MNTVLCIDVCVFAIYWLYVAITSVSEVEFLGRMCQRLIIAIGALVLQGGIGVLVR